jgi:hypothetical protein
VCAKGQHWCSLSHGSQNQNLNSALQMSAQVAKKYNLAWRFPCCGGALVHGTSECNWVQGKWECHCIDRPNNFNYDLHYILAVEVSNRKIHLDAKCGKKWSELAAMLFAENGPFRTYMPVQGQTLKQRLEHMLTEVKGRHGLESGYETHPEESKYDNLLLSMLRDVEEQAYQKDLVQKKNEG